MANQMKSEYQIALEAQEWFEDAEAVRRVCLEGEPCPTACPEGCTVEPDGDCPHGYPSHYKVIAMDWEYLID